MDKRVVWVDTLKGFGIIAVTLGHSGVNFLLEKHIYSYHMFLFFFIAGFLFKENRSIGDTIRRKTETILIPFLAWNTLTCAIQAISYNLSFGEFLDKLLIYKGDLCFNAPLWFLIVLFFTEVSYVVIKKYINNYVIIILSIVVFSLTCSMKLTLKANLIPLAMFAYAFGNTSVKLIKAYEKLSGYIRYTVMLVFGAISITFGVFKNVRISYTAGVFGNISYCVIAAFSGVTFFVLLFQQMFKNKNRNILSYIGEHSFFIMVTQYYIFALCNKAIEKYFGIVDIWHRENSVKAIAMCAITMAIIILIIDSINQIFEDNIVFVRVGRIFGVVRKYSGMNQFKTEWNKIKTKYESSKIISSRFVQKFSKYGEIIYLVAIACIIFNLGFVTTMMRELDRLAPIFAWVDFVAIGLLWAKVILGYAKDFNRLMLVMGVLFIMQSVGEKTGDQKIMLISLCIVGAYEVAFDKVLKVYVTIVLGLMTTAFVMAQLGYIENLKYYMGGVKFRYALGGVYPTDTTCHVLFVTLAILYLLKNKLKLWMVLVLGILALVLYKFTEGKTGVACILMALVGCYVVRRFDKWFEQKLNPDNGGIAKVINRAFIYSMALGACIFTAIVRIYMWKTRFRHYFPKTIGSRIGLSARAFRQYGIPMWGSPIQMKGFGGTTNQVKILDYFFLDCSYMWVLFVYGLVVLLIILGVFVAIGYKFKNDWYMLVILFVIALDCTIEHHLMDLSYNIFMVALVANCGANKFVWKKKQQESV